jgi:hypothetical protein
MLLAFSGIMAQQATDTAKVKLTPIQHLVLFGNHYPQEKVYLHIDNSCYFLGDTIWYKAYVTRSDNNHPSNLSKILYVELFSPDGFLVERQQVPISTTGNGYGCFALTDSLYGGYYELRAYTRWQLNFGEYDHPHSTQHERKFYNKSMAKDFFRDYDKLYSRVFPVYDRPDTAGQYSKQMTTRPLRRYFAQKAEEHSVTLTFFPEGGNLVAGTTTRIAFEAQDEKGRHVVLTGNVKDKAGQEVAKLNTTFRGKGVFLLPCSSQTGKIYTATVNYNNKSFSFPLPEVLPSGCNMAVDALADGPVNISIEAKILPKASADSLAVSVMCGGKVEVYHPFQLGGDGKASFTIPQEKLHTGVNEITLFDTKGEIFADRLFFINHHEYDKARLNVSGQKEEYKPYEPVTLDFQLKDATQPAEFSLSVRDHATDENSYDDSNILTEMLLGSDLKGFIEGPAYFFEKDDAEHRANLDLLLMVQGWRRYVWKDMAGLNNFQIYHMPEQVQTMEGCVNQTISYDDPRRATMEDPWAEHDAMVAESDAAAAQANGTSTDNTTSTESSFDANDLTYNMENSFNVLASRRSALKKEVDAQAEFVVDGKVEINDQMTSKGQFSLLMPQYFGKCISFLYANDDKQKLALQKAEREKADNARAKRSKAEKKQANGFGDEEAYPNYYVKRNLFYPLFVKPYSYYQVNLPEYTDLNWGKQKATSVTNSHLEGDHLLEEVVVRTHRSGLRKVDYSKPAYVADAYDMFNDIADYGLNSGYFVFDSFYNQIAYSLCADMGSEHNYFVQKRIDGKAINEKDDKYATGTSRNSAKNSAHGVEHPEMSSSNPYQISEGEKDMEWRLRRLDKVYVYTDYEPRHEGNSKYDGGDQPDVIIDIHKNADGGIRPTYRDRRYIISGFSSCGDFYNPDYSKQVPEKSKDYRRTLYWNPVVKTDATGKASVKFYNNSKCQYMTVSAEGITSDGIPVIN